MPPRWVNPDGQTIIRSKGQKILWEQWRENWEIIAKLRKKSRLVIIFNGDAIEGNHNGSTQTLTKNLDVQSDMHTTCMEYAMNVAKFNDGDLMYYLKGTEIHTQDKEDKIARDFKTMNGKYLVKPIVEPTAEKEWRDGSFARDKLVLDVNGVLFDIAHQRFNRGRRAWTTTNPMRAQLTSYYLDCLNYDMPIPRYIIGSHWHVNLTTEIERPKGKIRGFITPSFKLKDRFAYKVASLDINSIGMLYFVVEPDGESFYDNPSIIVDDAEVEKI